MISYPFDRQGGERWSEALAGKRPAFACVVGFTETCLIPGISAAGSTPEARRYTAAGDAEVLLHGWSSRLPTAPEGYPSPVVISRAVVQLLNLPVWILDSGLGEPCMGGIVLGGTPARCLSTGRAMSTQTVSDLFEQGLLWGERLAREGDYLVIGECVAGGTTTALAVLLGLGFAAEGLVNSSHPCCNHDQKQQLVRLGLTRGGLGHRATAMEVVAAVGDPVQPVVSGMLLAASLYTPVLLAGGSQMLAIAALAARLAHESGIVWQANRVAVGTTRWVAQDPSADAAHLARLVGVVPLLASTLSFAASAHVPLRAYERGYVKEGVGAGGLAIAAHLAGIEHDELLAAIEGVFERLTIG